MARKIFSAESAIYRIGRNIDLKEEEFKANGVLPKIKLKALREYTVECSLMKVYASSTRLLQMSLYKFMVAWDIV